MQPRRADTIVSVVQGLMLIGGLIGYMVLQNGFSQGLMFGLFGMYLVHIWWKMARSSTWFSDRLEDKMDEVQEEVENVKEDVEEVQEKV